MDDCCVKAYLDIWGQDREGGVGGMRQALHDLWRISQLRDPFGGYECGGFNGLEPTGDQTPYKLHLGICGDLRSNQTGYC